MKRALVLILLFISCSSADLSDNLRARINQIANAHPEASLAFYAVDVNSGEVICAHNAQMNLAPASILKTLTTAAALELLGPDFRFTTRFIFPNKIENGSLNGNIHVLPGGDPSLGSRFFNEGIPPENVFRELIEFLQSKGVKSIKGKIILHTHGFETERVVPNWSYDDLGNYYGASVAPLNCFDNTVFITFKSAGTGTPTLVTGMTPDISGLSFKNEVIAANIGYDNAYVYGSPRQYNRVLRGEIPANRSSFKVKASMPEPELYAMQQLVKELRNNEIEVPVAAVSIINEPAPESKGYLVHEMKSQPLSEIVKVVNIESHNLFAEGLLRAIALEKGGYWSREKAIKEVKAYFADKIKLENCNLYDGSGLSRFNGVSAQMMAELMEYMWHSKNKNVFYESLPVAGVSGSIKGMFKGSKAQNNLRAKSGYLEKVRSYSGYTKTATGKVAAFTVMVNNYATKSSVMRNDIESILRALAD